MTGQVLGTAAYISPEQARGETATAASDRYALAVVAYELLTGTRPFAVEHPAAQARAHVEGEVPRASDDADNLPRAVDAVLAAGMAKDPGDRPASAEDFVDRLEDALGSDAKVATGVPTATTAPVAIPRPPVERREPVAARGARPARAAAAAAPVRPAPRRGNGRRTGLIALAVLALLAGAVIAIAMSGGGGSSPSAGTTAKKRPSKSASTPAKTTKSTPQPAQTQAAPQTTSTPAPAPAAAPAGTDPNALNAKGYALYQAGKAAEAVPYEQKSVDQFRTQNRTGETNYAYALYNLGTALLDSGKPAEAIPYLQERLKISSDRRPLVQSTLAKAQQAAGQTPTQPGKAKGKKKKD